MEEALDLSSDRLLNNNNLEKPFNECCIIYGYLSSLHSQPNYPIVMFRHLFLSALPKAVCYRHNSVDFTLVLSYIHETAVKLRKLKY